MHETYVVNTWTCDIPDCKEQITRYGADFDELFDAAGWYFVRIFNERVDLCPFHAEEVRDFFFGEKGETK